MTSIFALLSVCVALAAGFSTGPPVDTVEGLCSAMFPSGHGVEAQTSDVPYEYVMSSTCYKASMEVKVAIKATHTDADMKYFEGFFTQVQKMNMMNTSYGIFATEDTEYSKALTCFDTANIAIGHQKHAHFDTRVFTWTAPATGTDDLMFRSTIVKGKETFWVNVYSSAITYDTNCTAGAFSETNTIQGDDTSTAPAILPGILTALATLLFALLL